MVKLSKTSPLREARKDFSGNLIRTNILQQEVKYLKSRVQETDCGHILTAISVLEDRIKATMQKNTYKAIKKMDKAN